MIEPWEMYPGIFKTQAAFFTYLRGQLRRIWSRYPPKLEWKKQQGVAPPREYKGRAKKLCKCFYCNEYFPISSTEVDHAEMAGSCNSWETANQFLHKLLDCDRGWRIACKPCHKIKSYAERAGMTFDEAIVEKQVIAFVKQRAAVVKEFLAGHGYSGVSVSTAKKRRALVAKILAERGQQSEKDV